jgi:hypothetical protein
LSLYSDLEGPLRFDYTIEKSLVENVQRAIFL